MGLLYILRAFVFTAYFMMPPTPASTLLFAAAMGMLWLSVAPLVSGLVAEMFGTRYMATLLGISFVMHQVGSSLGAYGGGLIFDTFGSYDRAWQIGVLIGFTRRGRPDPRRRAGAPPRSEARPGVGPKLGGTGDRFGCDDVRETAVIRKTKATKQSRPS